MQVYSRQQIEKAFTPKEAITAIEEGFKLLARGEVVIPPPATIAFDNPPGLNHIKSAYTKSGERYVTKLASYFPQNPTHELEAIQGLMLVFNQKTGEPHALLQDGGYLTYVRTAAAGAVSVKYLAPKRITAIGICGTGQQAFNQARYLKEVTACRTLYVWGRTSSHVQALAQKVKKLGFEVHRVTTVEEMAAACNVIITTTSAKEAIIVADDIQPGTHITAVGADHPDKLEVDPQLFARADCVAVDHLVPQLKGDTHHAIERGHIKSNDVAELADIITGKHPGRRTEKDITMADLVGIGMQDLQIALLATNKMEG